MIDLDAMAFEYTESLLDNGHDKQYVDRVRQDFSWFIQDVRRKMDDEFIVFYQP